MNNFDISASNIDELVKWLRVPKIYNIVILDMLIILLIVHWSKGYLSYLGFILLIIYVNQCMNNMITMPRLLRQYFGMKE